MKGAGELWGWAGRVFWSLSLTALLAAALAPATGEAAAQELPEDPASECCLLLLVPVSARASAMGGTNTAFRGPEAAFLNPAGLAGLDGGAFMVHHSDVNIDAQLDAFSLLLTPLGVSVSLAYQLFDMEEIPTTDPSGQITGEILFRDHLVLASAASPVLPGLSAGVSYRFFQQRIDCNGRSCGGVERAVTSHAFDAGLLYQPTWHPPLQIGLTVVNAELSRGTDDGARLPGRVHLGAAYDVLAGTATADMLALRLAADIRDALHDPGSPQVAVGLELDVQQAVFLRAGYARGEGLGTGAAVGVELRYDRFDISVSRSFINSQLGPETEPFQVSFGLRF